MDVSDDDRLQDLIAAVEPNVVRVDVTTEYGAGNGSGFLADPSGRIVTNYHVVEGCKSASVVFKAEGKKDSIRLNVDGFLHLDPKRDIAILQVSLPENFNRPGLRIAEKLPAKGSDVVAFGAPLGLDFTATERIISGVRSAKELEKTIGLEDHEGSWVQTTAAISPGNSGGPLVDRRGQVVGINTMTMTIGQQLNFSLAAGDIRRAVHSGTMYARTLTPKSAPIRIAQEDEGKLEKLPGGYNVYAIEKTAKARVYLRELEEVRLMTIAGQVRNGYDPIMEGLLRDFVRDAVQPNGVRIVIDEGPVLLLIAIVSGRDLELAAHLFVNDRKRPGRTLRIWRNAGDMGRLTSEMKRRKRFLGQPKENLKAFFADLHDALAEAKAEARFDDGDSDGEGGSDKDSDSSDGDDGGSEDSE